MGTTCKVTCCRVAPCELYYVLSCDIHRVWTCNAATKLYSSALPGQSSPLFGALCPDDRHLCVLRKLVGFFDSLLPLPHTPTWGVQQIGTLCDVTPHLE